jgi:hypothetical protein
MPYPGFSLPLPFVRRSASQRKGRPTRQGRQSGRGSSDGHLVPPGGEGGLPAIILRAQAEQHCTHALARLGYRAVRAEYTRHRRAGHGTFGAVADVGLRPSMDFVRAWLRRERRRILASTLSSFLFAMLMTLIAGLAFAGVLAFLSWRS